MSRLVTRVSYRVFLSGKISALLQIPQNILPKKHVGFCDSMNFLRTVSSRCTIPAPAFILRNLSSSSKTLDESEDLMKHLEAENVNNRRRKLSPSDAMINVGKLVPHKVLDLTDDNGETLKGISSSRAVFLSIEKDLKLVMVNQHAKPRPLYRLMTGSDLHHEQVKMNERRRMKAGPTVVKSVKLSATISPNDLNVKRMQIAEWLAKETNIQIRVAVMQKNRRALPKDEMVAIVYKLMDGLEVPLVFNNEPKASGKNGQNVGVVLRRMSAKERAKFNRDENLMEKMKSVHASAETPDGVMERK